MARDVRNESRNGHPRRSGVPDCEFISCDTQCFDFAAESAALGLCTAVPGFNLLIYGRREMLKRNRR
jgi:hypothetical protein